jgi:hypothetical protein
LGQFGAQAEHHRSFSTACGILGTSPVWFSEVRRS